MRKYIVCTTYRKKKDIKFVGRFDNTNNILNAVLLTKTEADDISDEYHTPIEFSSALYNLITNRLADKIIKNKRELKTIKDSCPLKGYCIYSDEEPFTCDNCPQKV